LDDSGIVGAYYKLDVAPSTDTDGSYVAGANIESITGISVTSDGVHTVYVWLNDSAGNVEHTNYATTQLNLDTTSPLSPNDLVATPDSWTNIDSFNLSWSNPSDTSGISGAYYKFGSVPTSNSDGIYVAGIDLDSLTEISIGSDGTHTIYIWLNDSAGNVDHTNYATTQLNLDTTSPLSPNDLVASPISWTNVDSFNLYWTNPLDDSGIVGAYYKLDVAPSTDTDGTYVASANIESITGISVTSDGVHMVYVWDISNPLIIDLQEGDNIWRNTAGTTYNVNFTDSSPSSNLDYAQYKITNETGQGGTVLKDWTDIFTDLGLTNYTADWSIDFDLCQEGFNYISVRVYDTAGNFETLDDVFYVKKDTTNPTLVINSPTDGSEWKNAPDIQVTANDPNLESVWYTIGGTKIMLTNGESEPLNSSLWDSLSDEGSFTIDFYVNDSAGNTNNTYSFTLYKDVLPPRLVVNLPINNTYYANPPPINITVFDSSLKLFYYMVETTQIPLTNNTEDTLDLGIWSNLAQGEFIIYLYAWDDLNNLNDTYLLRLYKDTLAPEIIINSPEDSTHFNSRPRINITAIDPNLNTLWYRVGTTNIILSSDIEELLNGSIWDDLAEGPFNIEIFANDTFGHLNNSYVLTLYKDITTPSLIIILPINETIYNSPPSINVTVFDSYFDTLWYRVGNTNITLNNNTEELLNLIIWDGLPEEGAFFIYFYANDSAGNLNNTLVLTLYKDIKAPTIIINSPQSNDLFGENSPSVSLNVQDANLEEVWYQLSNGTVITNNYTWTGSINQTVWNQVGNGIVTIRFYANDTFNHLGFAEVTVRKNIINPIITIENPQENELFGIIAPNFTIYKSGTELNTTWYTLDNGLTNFTFSGLNGTIDQDAWGLFGFGNVPIKFYINDSLGIIGFDEVLVLKDPNPPLITINSPDDGEYYADAPIINIAAFDPNLHKIWYRIGTTIITLTNNTDQALESSIWNNLSEGLFILEVFANDSLGYTNDSFILSLYKDTQAPQIIVNNPINQTYYNAPPPINITAYDPNLTNMYYMVGTTQVPLTNNVEQPLDIGIWNSLDQGVFEIYLYAWDSLNHLNDTYVITLYKDTNAPTVVVNLPIDYSYWNTPPIINIAAIDPNLHTIWYRVGTTIITLTDNTDQTLDDEIWDSLTEESFNLEIFANDSFGYLNNSITLTLYKDLTPPNININSPNNNTYYDLAPDILLIITDISIDSIWYSVGGEIRTLTNGISEPLDSNIWSNLPQGEFQVFIFANDSAGNLNNILMLTLFKDTLAPLINVNLPYNNTYWNSRPTINVEAFDPNLDEISYLVSGFGAPLENGNDTTLLTSIWQMLGEGPFIMEILAKDIFGHTNDSIKLTLYKDLTPPNIDINSPQPNDLFGENTPFVSLNVIDTNLEEVWYQLSNGTVVTNNYPWTGSIDQVVWDQVGNGTVTIRFYANDTAGNIGYKDITVRKNIFAPIITINSPGTNDLFGIAVPNFLIYKSGSELNSTWYTLDNGITNITFTELSGTIDQDAWDNFGFDIITLRFYVNDSFGKIGFDEVSIRKDPDMPIITINSPINHTAFASSPFINLTIDEPNLDKVWYSINNNLIDITDNVTQFIDFFIWNSLPQGEFNVELFANDTMGNINYFNTLYLSKDIIGPNITILKPIENQKVDRNGPYFELSIVDENNVDSRWYRIEGGEIILFTGPIGRIDQNLWEQIWDNLPQGAIITIRFYAKDTLGNENFAELNLIVEKPLKLPKFLSDPLGLLLPTLGLVVMIPLTIQLTKSRYYKSLNNKDKKKLKNGLITAGFFLSLLTLYFIF
jgi:hypothetical protein